MCPVSTVVCISLMWDQTSWLSLTSHWGAKWAQMKHPNIVQPSELLHVHWASFVCISHALKWEETYTVLNLVFTHRRTNMVMPGQQQRGVTFVNNSIFLSWCHFLVLYTGLFSLQSCFHYVKYMISEIDISIIVRLRMTQRLWLVDKI